MKLHLPTGLRAALIAAISTFAMATTAFAAETGTQTFGTQTVLNRGDTVFGQEWYVTKDMTAGTATANLTGLSSSVNIRGGNCYANDYTVSIWVSADSLESNQLLFAYAGGGVDNDTYGANAIYWDAANHTITIGRGKVTDGFTSVAWQDHKTSSDLSTYLGSDDMVNFTFAVSGGDQNMIPSIWVNGENRWTADAKYAGNMNKDASPLKLYVGSGATYGNVSITNEKLTEQDAILTLMGLSTEKPGEVFNYVWTGSSSATWDTTTKNWVTQEDKGTPVLFTSGEENTVTFGADASIKAVTLGEPITAGVVKVDGAAYEFAMDGKTLNATELAISGTGASLALTGEGSVTATQIAAAGKTINVGENVVLQGTGAAILDGKGTYALASGAKAKPGDISLADSWVGTVAITNAAFANDLVNVNSMRNANSWVLLKGTSGWSGNNTFEANLILENGANGWAFAQNNGNNGHTLNFTGKIKGDGKLGRINTTGSTYTYAFSGDISGWTGTFESRSFDDRSTTFRVSGDATVINADLVNAQGNLYVEVQTNATFNSTIDATRLTVNSGNTATLNVTEDYTFSGVIAGDGAIAKSGDKTITLAATNSYTGGTTVKAGTLKATAQGALGTGAVTVDADGTLDLAVGNALGSAQTVTNSGNVVLHETLTSGSITGGTVTIEMEGTGGLEDADGSRDTGNGFSLGGEVQVNEVTASTVTATAMMYGGKNCIDGYNSTTGILSLGGGDWSVYQLNVSNFDQPTLSAIQAKSVAKGTSLASISVGGTEDSLTLQNDTTDGSAKTSLFTGSNVASLYLEADADSVTVVDADFAGTILSGWTIGATAMVRLAEDGKSVHGISAQSGDEVNTIQIEGSGKSVNVDELTAAAGVIQILDGVTVNAASIMLSAGTGTQIAVKAGAKLNAPSVAVESADGSADAIVSFTDTSTLGDEYTLSKSTFTLANAKLTVTSTDDVTLGNARTGKTSLVNAGTGKVTDNVAAVTAYEELNADGGDIALAGKSGVTVGALTLANGRQVTSDSAVTVTGTATFGSGTAVISALTFNNGSTLDEKDGAVSLENNDLTLVSSITLGNTLKSAVESLTTASPLTLFSNVSSLTLGSGAYSVPVDASTIFSGLAANKYLLSLESDNTVIISKSQNTDRYWKGGSGDWNTTSTVWMDQESGGTDVTFESGYNAHFAADNGGTVTLRENITAANVYVTGADYTFAAGGYTLTVTDLFEVDDHSATLQGLGLNGANLKLAVMNGGELVLNGTSSVKAVEIGKGVIEGALECNSGSLTITDSLVNNGSLYAETLTLTQGTAQGGNVEAGTLNLADNKSYTFGNLAAATISGSADVTIGDSGSLYANSSSLKSLTTGDSAHLLGNITVAGATNIGGGTTMTGNLTTGTLTGYPLSVSNGHLTIASGSLAPVQFTGTSSVTTNGTITLDGALGNNGDLTLKGTYDASNLGASKSDSKYVEGGSTDNGFEQARLTLTIVEGGNTIAGEATIRFRDKTLTEKVDANGKVTFGGDIDYTKYYVNSGTENASKALDNPNQRLGTFELKTGTKLLADRDFDISMVNAAGAATLEIANGHKVTSNGQTKPLTLTGSGTLAVDAGKTATGVTLDNTWTGTVSFTEAELATLDGAWKSGSTVSLTGVTGSLGSTPIGAAVILNKGTGDWGFGQTATGTQVVTLNGAITGAGNLGVKSGTEDSTFNLNGDINGWNGNFIVATDADTTLNLGGSGAKTVNGTVSGTNLEVNVNADTTFSGALNVEKLTVGTSKAATLKADSTVNEVNASNGSLKVDDGKTLTVTESAAPGGLLLGEESAIRLQGSAYLGGADYRYIGGYVENRTYLDQAVSTSNVGITVTGTTLRVDGGSGFTVDNKLVDATLDVKNGLPSTVILNNVQDSLEVAGDLEIGPSGLLKVAKDNGSSKQTLNISGGTTLTLADSTTLDADLTLNSGATLRLDYNMSSPVATSLESGALTLASGLTLSGDLYTQIEGMEDTGSFVNLFKGVGALTLGESAYSEPVKAQLYFSNMEDLDEKGDYWLEYNADTDIVSIRFEATSAHTLTWNGTATEHRWVQDNDTVTDWLEGNPAASAYFQEGDNAKFTADAAEKTVTIEQDITARNITIDSPDCYTFENSDDYSITAQKFEMTGHDGLAKTGEGKLTLDIIGDVSLTESALMVQEGSLEIGTAAKSGKLDLQASALEIAEDAELSVASIEGDGTSSIELAGTMTVSEGTVSNLTATEGSLLKIADLGQTTAGTLSVDTDTTLYGLENGGTLDLGNKTLNLMEQTEQGGNVTAGKLNLAENGNEFKELGTNRVTYAYGSEGSGQLDADAPNLVVDSIAPTMVIPSIALDVTEAMGDGGSLGAINRLGDEVTYTLIHANNGLGTVGFTLDDDKLHELIQNGLLSADGGLEKTENDVTLTVGGLDLTWNTSKDETEWGYKVVDETGALTDGANTLNGVQHVVVDEDRTVDVTGVGSEPGLRVRNLAGLDGSTITFSGEEGDTVNLITTEETASNVNLAAENITVKVGLDELDGMDPEDYKDLRVGDVDLTGATLAVHSYEDLDAAFTVNTLSGDDESTLKGRVIVEGQGGEYFGGYENAYVILHENAEQTLAAGEGLTVAGLGAAKLAYVGPETHMDGIEGINMTVTLNDPKQDNSGATLVLDKPSWLVDGTIISGMSAIKSGATLDTAEAPNLIQAAGLNLDGTTIILNQDAADDSAMAMTVNALGKTKGLYLAHLGAEDSNTDRVLLNGYLYNKYYQNARLERGMLLVDRRDAFFTEDVVRPTTVNGRAGAGMLDDALLEINPQATNPQGDLAAVMTALETNAVANPDRVAAAVAGASAAALGHAFNNDVQRQLRAIRNRTTTMGLAECVKHEGLPYVNAWVNAEGDYRKLDADGTLAGYTLSSWGGTIGCDVDLTGRLTVGAAFTVLHGEFTSHSADMCEGDLDRDYVSLFARYGYRAWTHTFVATLGFAKSKVDRTVNYGTGSYTTRGDSNGNAFGFLYEVGYTKALNEDASTCLQPIFNVNYRHSSLGGYTEKGGSDAALSVGSADMDAVTFGLGARLQSIVGTSVYNRATLFEGRVLAKLDAGDRDCTTNSSLIGVSAKRSVKSAEVGAFGVEVGAGLTIPVGETGGSIFMDVTGDFRSGYTEFNGTVGYRFSF